MDPIILRAAEYIATLASATLSRLGSLQHLLEEERELADKYRRSVATSQDEIGRVKAVFSTTILYCDPTVLSNMLNSEEGKKAFANLSASLESIDSLLYSHINAANQLITKLEGKEIRCADAITSLIVDSKLSNEDKLRDALRKTLATLDEQKAEVRRSFDHFTALYKLFESRQPRWQEPASFSRYAKKPGAGEYNDLLNVLRVRFFANAFNVGIDQEDYVEVSNKIHCLRDCPDWDITLTTMMESLGRSWVENELDNEDVQTCRNLQIRMFQKFLKFVSVDTAMGMPATVQCAKTIHRESWDDLDLLLKRATQQASKQRYSIAFCGLVKAGKSSFLNALIGRPLLPINELPSTAWPLRVRHVHGQSGPALEFDPVPFQSAIQRLRELSIWRRMVNYSPPSDGVFVTDLDDEVPTGVNATVIPSASEHAEVSDLEVFKKWNDLHRSTKENIGMLSRADYVLSGTALGEGAVEHLLSVINDIVRLCHRFGIPFSHKTAGWPLLKVELEALKDVDINGTYEFIDLPGIGEYLTDSHSDDLMRAVASEVNIFVPVLSPKEISQSNWRHLPTLIRSATARPPELVVCTHLDQECCAEVIDEIRSRIIVAFWPKSPSAHKRVVACSSSMGLSAHSLKRLSEHAMPSFRDFWDKSKLEYTCAKEILGTGCPDLNFKYFEGAHAEWIQVIDEQIKRSGLNEAITRLTTGLVVNAQRRQLLHEAKHVRMLVKKSVAAQKRFILEAQRSQREYEHAFEQFLKVKTQFTSVLKTWEAERCRAQVKFDCGFNKALKRLEDTGRCLAKRAVQSTLSKHPEVKCSHNIITEFKLDFVGDNNMREFLDESQKSLQDSILLLKKQLAIRVRDLAIDSLQQQTDFLKRLMESSEENNVQRDLQSEIAGELDDTYEGDERQIASVVERLEEKANHARWTFVRSPWPLRKETVKRLLKVSDITREFDTNIIAPILDGIRNEWKGKLSSLLDKRWSAERRLVEDALQREQMRYDIEKHQKGKPMPEEKVTAALSALANFLSIDAAMKRLMETTPAEESM